MDATALRRLAGKRGSALGILEKDQAITVALGVFAELPAARSLAFKGGTALGKVYFAGYRFSEDLDFTALSDVASDVADATDRVIAAGNRAGIRFLGIERQPTGPRGRRLRVRYEDFNGHPNSIRVEISVREKVLRPAESRAIRDPYRVLSKPARIPTMALPEILAEKVRALYMRSQARDLFDLGFLLERGIRPDPELIRAKLAWWKPDLHLDPEVVADRIGRLEATWERDLEALVDRLPPFREVATRAKTFLARASGKS